jgi:hypothetical protein
VRTKIAAFGESDEVNDPYAEHPITPGSYARSRQCLLGSKFSLTFCPVFHSGTTVSQKGVDTDLPGIKASREELGEFPAQSAFF